MLCYESSFGADLLSDSEFNSFLGFETARAYLEEARRMFAVCQRQFKVQSIGEDLDFFFPIDPELNPIQRLDAASRTGQELNGSSGTILRRLAHVNTARGGRIRTRVVSFGG